MNNNLDDYQIVDIVFAFGDTSPEIIFTYINPIKLLEKKETYVASSITVEDEYTNTFYSDSSLNMPINVIDKTIDIRSMTLVKTEINKLG